MITRDCSELLFAKVVLYVQKLLILSPAQRLADSSSYASAADPSTRDFAWSTLVRYPDQLHWMLECAERDRLSSCCSLYHSLGCDKYAPLALVHRMRMNTDIIVSRKRQQIRSQELLLTVPLRSHFYLERTVLS